MGRISETVIDMELDPYWREIELLGECRWGVESEFFDLLVSRVWYKVYNGNRMMVDVLRADGWDYEDMRQEVALRMYEVWNRVDWGLRNRHKIFAFFVRCAWQVLALRYRRVKGRPLVLSLEGLVELGDEGLVGEGLVGLDGLGGGEGLGGGCSLGLDGLGDEGLVGEGGGG